VNLLSSFYFKNPIIRFLDFCLGNQYNKVKCVPIGLARLESFFVIFSLLLIFPLISNVEGIGQTTTEREFHLNPGESHTYQWGLLNDEEETIVLKLWAEGDGKELLSFPETLEVEPSVWTFLEITITIPEDHPNDVLLEPQLYALIDRQRAEGSVAINVQLRNLPMIFIGNPVIEEVVEEKPQTEEVAETVEEKPAEKEQEPGEFIISAPEEQETAEEGGGCLISTATFGSEFAPQVQMLREIRDNKLLSTESGSSFMAGFNTLYYSFSPAIADMERQSPIFKEAVKITITPLITSLSILNYVDMDSEAEVLGYGISLIILNIGMYFVAPAILITKLRR